MILRTPLTIHLLVVIEKVWVDLVEEPWLACDCLLHSDEGRAGNPVDKGARGPLMSERQVEELQDLEETTEPIHKPVLILLSDSSLHWKSINIKRGKIVHLHLD